MKFKSLKSLHFIGIGGSGMSPLAELSLLSGIKVTGSDSNFSEEIERLRSLGITIYDQHLASNIQNVDAIVVSSAIKNDNPELKHANDSNIQVLHRSDLLNSIMNGYQSIAVAGTHGKTTTTAMISHMLIALNLDPSFAIGGKIPPHNSSCRLGSGQYFVAEADESDGTFLLYSPFISIINNIANDHMDYYETEESIDEHFIKFGKNTKNDGFLIVGWEDERCRNLKEHFPNKIFSFGFNIGCDVRCYKWDTHKGQTTFSAIIEKEKVECTLPMPGKHNVLNALCALAVAKCLNLDLQQAAKSLLTFPGVKRRFEKIYADEQTLIIDDYAHNPDKIRSCIEGLKKSWPHHKLNVCFQPHRYTRLSSLYTDFLKSFSDADRVIVTPVYAAGEVSIDGYDEKTVAQGISEYSNVTTFPAANLSQAAQIMFSEKDVLTIFLTVGAGDVYKVGTDLKNLI